MLIMSNYYLVLSSNDYSETSEIYAENSADDFTIDLTETFVLSGAYECAITYLYCEKKNNNIKNQLLYLFCDICVDSYIREQRLPILKLFDNRVRADNNSLIQQYIPLKTNSFNKIRIYIRNSTLKPGTASGLKFVSCVLHIRKSLV